MNKPIPHHYPSEQHPPDGWPYRWPKIKFSHRPHGRGEVSWLPQAQRESQTRERASLKREDSMRKITLDALKQAERDFRKAIRLAKSEHRQAVSRANAVANAERKLEEERQEIAGKINA